MTTEPTQTMRYPLGLPAGSVRSMISMLVVGLFCALVLMSTAAKPIVLPSYLIGLVILVFIGFVSAHGRSMNKRSGEKGPLGLPRWSVVLFLAVALGGTVAYKMTQAMPGLEAQLLATMSTYSENPLRPFYAVLYILAGHFVGHLSQFVFGVDRQPAFYQDFIAWISLLALVGMTVDILVTLVINPNLRTHSPIDLSVFESVLAGIISFYFAARS